MPELPDIEAYLAALRPRLVGQPLDSLAIPNPFLVRTFDPPIADLVGHRVQSIERLGKRIIFAFDDELFLVLHLMIAGRLHWFPAGSTRKGVKPLAAFHFPAGRLTLTEAGTTRRASLHLVRGHEALSAFDRGGLEVLDLSPAAFAARLTSENHTLKRALTDPRLFSGIGNAYSDEILHRARLSPMVLTSKISTEDAARLLAATKSVLIEWRDRFVAEAVKEFPENVTAFRPEMAVHGRYGKPCPVCGSPVQRIRYASNETNYCPACQTGGRLLADRALSRLLKKDWPKSLEEMDELKAEIRGSDSS